MNEMMSGVRLVAMTGAFQDATYADGVPLGELRERIADALSPYVAEEVEAADAVLRVIVGAAGTLS